MSLKSAPDKTSVPDELLAAVNHLHKSFDTIHFQFGWTTEQLCFWQLHGKQPKAGVRNLHEYAEALPQLKQRVGTAASQRFDRMLARGTLPAIFKSFYDLYMEGLKVQIELIFSGLLQIALANRKSIRLGPIEWAKRLSEELVDSHHHKIPLWIKAVCDDQPYDPYGYRRAYLLEKMASSQFHRHGAFQICHIRPYDIETDEDRIDHTPGSD